MNATYESLLNHPNRVELDFKPKPTRCIVKACDAVMDHLYTDAYGDHHWRCPKCGMRCHGD